jgi:hypothetical protein
VVTIVRHRLHVRQEVIAMAHGLGEDEQRVQDDRRDRRKRELRRREGRTGRARRECRKNEADGRERDTVANAVAVPSALKVATCRLKVDTTRQSPTTPLQVIIAAAKTVSRARLSVSDLPAPSARR